MANINIKIPDDVHKRLRLESIQKDTTLKFVVIEKLSKFSKKNEK